jgi:hypothetical protein
LGSFQWLSAEQKLTSTIMFEYAENGTLQDLFERAMSPYQMTDIVEMWKGFLGLIEGIETIHKQANLRA